MLITSRSNPRIKQIRKLANNKERRSTETYFVGGPHLVLEALKAGVEIVELILCSEWFDTLDVAIQEKIELAADQHSTLYLNQDVFSTLSERRDHFFGCAAVVRQNWTRLDDAVPDKDTIWLAAHAIQYPANLGTMMRTLDGVGGSGLILLGDSTDPYDPAAVRASQGSVFRHRLIRTDTAGLGHWLQKRAMHVIGTSPAAATMYRDLTYRRPCLILMGNERSGLGSAEMELCDDLVTIPMLGQCDSHNVAAAAALILYEAHFRASS